MIKFLFLTFLTFSLISCSQNYMTLAKVNGETISVGDFKKRLAEIQFDPKFQAEDEILSLKKNILNEMIEEKITTQEARHANIRVTPDELDASSNIENLNEELVQQHISKNYWMERSKQKILAEKLFEEITKTAPHPSEDEIKQTYDKKPELFHQNEQVHVAQIVMKSKDEIKEVQKALSSGQDFVEFAKNRANATEGTTSGDLGFIEHDLLPEELDKKVFGIKSGSTSPVIEYDSQFYLFKVLEKKEDRQLWLQEVRERIESMLFQQAKESLYAQWLQDKTIKAKIKRNYALLQENIRP